MKVTQTTKISRRSKFFIGNCDYELPVISVPALDIRVSALYLTDLPEFFTPALQENPGRL
jgi:hypothetical protein